MTPTHQIECSAATHPGLKRDNNEDCYLSAPECGLWLVADGMGGHEAGEVASAIVRDTLDQLVHEPSHFSLNDAIQKSHETILMSADNGIGAHGMGSTVVALYSQQKSYQIAWVGDSRAYLWNRAIDGGQLSRLSTDHSYVQMLYASGAINEDEVDKHPDKNIITQCLGMQELAQVKVDMTQGQWHHDQWILLCSDGLTDELKDEEIADILRQNSNTVTAVDQLLHGALNNGGNDNITVQIIQSPVGQHAAANALWNWVPQISSNRTADAVIFIAALLSLFTLLVVTI